MAVRIRERMVRLRWWALALVRRRFLADLSFGNLHSFGGGLGKNFQL